jgi:two-component system NtrC family sensor kinase
VRSLPIFSRLNEAERKSVKLRDGIDSILMIIGIGLKATQKHPDIKIVK